MKRGRFTAVLALAASIGLLALALSALPVARIPAWGWDASVFRAASRAWLAGENPYDPASIPRFAQGAQLATIPYYVYAPFFAIGFLPFAMLPPDWTLRLWFLANLVMIVASVALTLQPHRGPVGPRILLLAVAAAALFPPVRTLLILGQSSAVLLLGVAVSSFLIRRRRPLAAGLSLSLAFFKPHLLFLPIFLALRRQLRTLFGLGIGLFVLAVPAAFWLDDWWSALLQTRAVNLSYGCLPFASVHALLTCVLPSGPTTPWTSWALLGVILLAGLVLCLRRSSPGDDTFELQWALAIVVGLMVLDNVRVADLVLLLFPLTLLLRHYGSLPRTVRLPVAGLGLLGFVFPYAAHVWASDAALGALPVWYSVTSLAFFAALAIASLTLPRVSPAERQPMVLGGAVHPPLDTTRGTRATERAQTP